MTTKRGPAVIVMARTPVRGQGKTRLRAELSEEERFRLQQAFMHDALDVAKEAQIGQAHIAYTREGSEGWAEGQFGGGVVPFAQEGDDLGARMQFALQHVAANGFAPLIMIGTDAPLIQPRHLRAALRALDRADLCIGPSADGGYYLLACRGVEPKLFSDVPWSTNRVLDTTLRIAAQSGLCTSLLETLYDIDTPADLALLQEDLPRLANEPAFRPPRHTAELLLP